MKKAMTLAEWIAEEKGEKGDRTKRCGERGCRNEGTVKCKAKPTRCWKCCVTDANRCDIVKHKYGGIERAIELRETEYRNLLWRLAETEKWKKVHLKSLVWMDKIETRLREVEAREAESARRETEWRKKEKEWSRKMEDWGGKWKIQEARERRRGGRSVEVTDRETNESKHSEED